MTVRIVTGDALDAARSLAPGSVNCIVTSPPYWGLRDYGTARWEGGDPACDHRPAALAPGRNEDRPTYGDSYATNQTQLIARGRCGRCGRCGATKTDAQLGLEPSPDAYVARLVAVFAALRDALMDDGTLWVNLGDSYCAAPQGSPSRGTSTLNNPDRNLEVGNQKQGTRNRGVHQAEHAGIQARRVTASGPHAQPNRGPIAGLKPKDLVGIPWRVATALRDDGWFLRRDIIWAKPNHLPESVEDRPVSSHEYLFLLSKSSRYHYAPERVRLPAAPSSLARWEQFLDGQAGSDRANGGEKTNGMKAAGADKQRGHGRRHAGFSDRWDAMVRAEQVQGGCHLPSVWWIAPEPTSFEFCHACGRFFSRAERAAIRVETYADPATGIRRRRLHCPCGRSDSWVDHFAVMPTALVNVCLAAGCPDGGSVWDPFLGAGTAPLVAARRGLSGGGSELNPRYAALAKRRIESELGLLHRVEACPAVNDGAAR